MLKHEVFIKSAENFIRFRRSILVEWLELGSYNRGPEHPGIGIRDSARPRESRGWR